MCDKGIPFTAKARDLMLYAGPFAAELSVEELYPRYSRLGYCLNVFGQPFLGGIPADYVEPRLGIMFLRRMCERIEVRGCGMRTDKNRKCI